MIDLTITLPGVPVATPRARAVSIGGHARVHNPATYTSWKGAAASIIRSQVKGAVLFPADMPARVDILAVWPRSKSAPKTRDLERKPRTSRPDCDNVTKAALDAATLAGVWHDDAQVTTLIVRKRVGARGEEPRVEIRFRDDWKDDDGLH